ncbi:MAG: hypothetical protein M3067_12910 [Chloroflexota bacterium]|nr:hypothetical protein [Chloroflexota bacterium]
MSQRLRALVKDPVERIDIERDGWWADLVLDEFAFLKEHGYELAQVRFHFRGNFVRFLGRKCEVVLTYAPEDGGYFDAELWFPPPHHPRVVPLDRLLVEHDPTLQLPPKTSFDSDTITAWVRMWAAGLRQFAPQVL